MRGPVCLPRFSPFPRQTLPEPDWLHGRSYLAATAKSQEALGKREEARGWAPEGPCPLSLFSPSPWQRVLRLARRSVGSIGSSAC